MSLLYFTAFSMACRRYSGLYGFIMKSKAPLLMAFTAMSSSAYAVMRMTGTSLSADLIFSRRSMPEVPGIFMSVRTASGTEALKLLRASSAFLQIVTL